MSMSVPGFRLAEGFTKDSPTALGTYREAMDYIRARKANVDGSFVMDFLMVLGRVKSPVTGEPYPHAAVGMLMRRILAEYERAINEEL